MKIPANQLAAGLKKSLLPCYLVSGDDPLLAQEAQDAIRAAARESGFGSRELHVAGSGFDWQELSHAGSSLSLFAERRIIELRLPTGKPGKAGAAAIVELLQHVGDDLLLLISSPKLDKRSLASGWVKAVEARGGLVQVWPVGLRELPAWIQGRMRQRGLQPDADAVALIVDRVEGNLLAAQQEIEKLCLLSGPGPVSAADVDAAVADSSRFDVYKLVDAAVAGNAPRALRILGGVRTEGPEPVIVMWALTRELRVLANCADEMRRGVDLSAALRAGGVWRSRQALVRSCVSRHSLDHFYGLLMLAHRADAAAKGQYRADPWQLAADLVVGLAGAGSRAA